jgi:bifunctional DNA-binding transcriptional regulator/antitoxin component of YhaV-PrlF toxin-antitoxin module
MEITKLSTKGQIIIPEIYRRDLEVGTPFTVTKKDNLIVLKVVTGLTSEEESELKELDKIWKGIDSGKGVTQSKKDFLNELENW